LRILHKTSLLKSLMFNEKFISRDLLVLGTARMPFYKDNL
jgi:hypothetical protein